MCPSIRPRQRHPPSMTEKIKRKWNLSISVAVMWPSLSGRRNSHMTKIAFTVAAAAAVLMTAPLLAGVSPANAQGLKVAQGAEIEVGRDRDRYDRDHRRDNGVTVGVGPGGVT